MFVTFLWLAQNFSNFCVCLVETCCLTIIKIGQSDACLHVQLHLPRTRTILIGSLGHMMQPSLYVKIDTFVLVTSCVITQEKSYYI